jgi:Fe-S-cluster containining protein|uniref:YkgJ family cysteine cluster protein n=1 Tax=Leptospirillum ferriphilum TaxID=178606 RepID=A0A7C3QTP0_9BACT
MIQVDVPHALCQSCRQCCHFMTPPEMTPFASRLPSNPEQTDALPPEFRVSGISLSLSPGHREGLTVWTCTLLDEEKAVCGAWPGHPLDCRIYPLVFTLDQGDPWIALDSTCPFSSHRPKDWFLEKALEIRDQYWDQWDDCRKRSLCYHFSLDTFPNRTLLVRLDRPQT